MAWTWFCQEVRPEIGHSNDCCSLDRMGSHASTHFNAVMVGNVNVNGSSDGEATPRLMHTRCPSEASVGAELIEA
jgi:hypothetical protein